jgi:hypothetical protein
MNMRTIPKIGFEWIFGFVRVGNHLGDRVARRKGTAMAGELVSATQAVTFRNSKEACNV